MCDSATGTDGLLLGQEQRLAQSSAGARVASDGPEWLRRTPQGGLVGCWLVGWLISLGLCPSRHSQSQPEPAKAPGGALEVAHGESPGSACDSSAAAALILSVSQTRRLALRLTTRSSQQTKQTCC